MDSRSGNANSASSILFSLSYGTNISPTMPSAMPIPSTKAASISRDVNVEDEKANKIKQRKRLQEKFRSNFFHLKSTPIFNGKDGQCKSVYVINKQLTCKVCGRFYSSTSSLRNHVRMKHSSESSGNL
eukprot:Awhi_evm1s2794